MDKQSIDEGIARLKDSLENQLFSWMDWDGNHETMSFYEVELKVQIGDFGPGTKFGCATIFYQDARLELYNINPIIEGTAYEPLTIVGNYRLGLCVRETIYQERGR